MLRWLGTLRACGTNEGCATILCSWTNQQDALRSSGKHIKHSVPSF